MRPESLISTFAHEFAHYLIHSVDAPTPGGEELEEHATDLVAVFMGFGVFLASTDSLVLAASTEGQLRAVLTGSESGMFQKALSPGTMF